MTDEQSIDTRDYCFRCEKLTETFVRRLPTATAWDCKECGHEKDFEVDDDGGEHD